MKRSDMWDLPTVNGKLRSQFGGEQVFAGEARHVSAWRLPVTLEKNRVEMVLRKAIPVLIIMFLICVALARGFSLLASHSRMESAVRQTTESVATLAVSALDEQPSLFTDADRKSATSALENTLSQTGMGSDTDLVLVDTSGIVFAATGKSQSLIGRSLSAAFPGLMVPHEFSRTNDTGEIKIGGTAYQVVPRLVGDDGGLVIALHSLQQMHNLWRAEFNLNVTLFAATAVLLLVVLYAYYTQLARNGSIAEAMEAEAETRGLMLANGETGLWAFSPTEKSAFLDRSAAAVLGDGAKVGYYSYRQLFTRVHPDDRSGLARHMRPSAEGLVQHNLRLKQHDGLYARFEIRAVAASRNGIMTLSGAAIRACDSHRREQNALRSAGCLQSAFDALPHALAVWKANGKLLTANKAFCEAHALEASTGSIDRSEIEEAGDHGQRLVRRKCNGATACEIKTADGRWLKVSETRIETGETLAIGTDITEFKTTQMRLQAEQVRLREKVNALAASRRKLEQEAASLNFVLRNRHTAVSTGFDKDSLARHSAELRNGLTAVLGFSELLLAETDCDSPAATKVAEYAQCINNGGNALKALAETFEASTPMAQDQATGGVIRRRSATSSPAR